MQVTSIEDLPVTATIVSFLPYQLTDPKPGLIPPFFIIPAVREDLGFVRDDFVVVPITDCLNDVYLRDGMSLRRTIPGYEVAGAIANDHIEASPYKNSEAFPGIKALPGKHTKEEVKKNFQLELNGLLKAQQLWFGELIRKADETWGDPNFQHKHSSISDLQRYACKYHGLNREWMTFVKIDNVPCLACGFMIPKSAPVCMNCKTVLDQKALDERLRVAVK